MAWERFDINLLRDGAVIESLHEAVNSAFHDIHDHNKPADKARKVVLTLEFIPDVDRLKVATKAVVKTAFPAENPNIDLIQIEPNTKIGYINASEQLPLGYDPETGEVQPMIRKDSQS